MEDFREKCVSSDTRAGPGRVSTKFWMSLDIGEKVREQCVSFNTGVKSELPASAGSVSRDLCRFRREGLK